jgi:phage terminase small subunit
MPRKSGHRKMPILKKARHEKFAQELACGKTAREAYKVAGYAPDDGHASRLAGNGKVATRVAELQQAGAEKSAMTAESLIAEADRIQKQAERLNQPSAAVAALIAKAKLGGLWIERSENKNENTEHVIGRTPWTAEEWLAKYGETSH